jgi:hypothetical protein
MTMESAAGKNPVPHVGKLYNLCASLVAQHLVTEIPEIAAVQCFMVSEIGRPIDQPQIIAVRVEPTEGRHLNTLRRPIQAVVSSQLEAMRSSRPSCSTATSCSTAGLSRGADPTFGSGRGFETDQGRPIDHRATEDDDVRQPGRDVRCPCN